jgi:hypothetical protein
MSTRGRPAAPERSAAVSYLVWGVIGLSILVEFGLLLFLQSTGSVEISDRGGALSASGHVALASALFIGTALMLGILRQRLRNSTYPLRSMLLAWAGAEGLALVGFTLALTLAPLPRLAITIYFTGALLLWLLNRPKPAARPPAGGARTA